MFYQNFNGVITYEDVMHLILLFIFAIGVICGFFYIVMVELGKKEND